MARESSNAPRCLNIEEKSHLIAGMACLRKGLPLFLCPTCVGQKAGRGDVMHQDLHLGVEVSKTGI